jgi:hypothetical protein
MLRLLQVNKYFDGFKAGFRVVDGVVRMRSSVTASHLASHHITSRHVTSSHCTLHATAMSFIFAAPCACHAQIAVNLGIRLSRLSIDKETAAAWGLVYDPDSYVVVRMRFSHHYDFTVVSTRAIAVGSPLLLMASAEVVGAAVCHGVVPPAAGASEARELCPNAGPQ